MKGVYALVLEVSGDVEVGALGTLGFDGEYAYVGSALGPGGFKRVARHLRVAEEDAARWHVDYILRSGTPRTAFLTETDRDLECDLAGLVRRDLPPVEGFGASDCSCGTHLFGPGDATEAAARAHGDLERQPQ